MSAPSKSKPAEAAEGEEAPAGGGKKKMLIIIVAAVVLLLGGGGGAAWFLGMFGGGDAKAAAKADAPEGEHGKDAGAAADGAHAEEGKPADAGHGAEAQGGDAHGEAKPAQEQHAAADAKPADGHGEAAAADAGHGGGGDGHGDAAGGTGVPGVQFVDLPDVLVNLQSEGRRMRFLKLSVALEVADEPTKKIVQGLAPRILDGFQLYLRTLTIEDLRGAAPVHRMKEQLLARINQAVAPQRVEDVLVKEMLVQ